MRKILQCLTGAANNCAERIIRCAFCSDPFVYGRKWVGLDPDAIGLRLDEEDEVAGIDLVNLGLSYPRGTTFDVDWVRIEQPDSSSPTNGTSSAAPAAARLHAMPGRWRRA